MNQTPESPLLTIQAVSRAYGSRPAVAEASLALRAGEITALLGASGSGKSTLLRLIAGLEPVDSGEIRLGDILLSGPGRTLAPERRGIGLVFQDYALFPHLSVLDNVRFGLKGLTGNEQRSRAEAALERVGLRERASAWPQWLSGGEQQRVALARAMVRGPEVLLLDEPFSGLDAHLKAGVRRDLTGTLRAAGTATLIVTHDAGEALMMADRLVLMENGRVIQSGTPADCYRDPVSVAAARLLGEVNVIPVAVEGGVARTPLGPVAAPTLEDGPAQLLLRPHDLGLAAGGPAARVMGRGFAGAFSQVEVQLGEQVLQIHLSGPAPAVGETVAVSADMDRARLVAV
jgi:iron(III) transport system ATP-binding protein